MPPVTTPLSWWQHAWRMVVALFVSGMGLYNLWPSQLEDHRWLFVVDVTLGLVAFVLVFFRRRRPVAIALINTLLTLFSASAAGPSLLAFVSLATRREWRNLIPIGALGVVAGQIFYELQPPTNPDPAWLNLTWSVIITVAVAAIGMYVGSRRELLWTLRERARDAESEQELRLAQARSSERERIAREMHDVLAHRISLVTMHAGALAYRTDLDPDKVRETAELINATSQEALTELREVLGTLRNEGVRPQPAYDDIHVLIGENPEATLHDEVDDRVPDRIGRTAYRIVQEALTNARKHAPGQPVTVTISGEPGSGLSLEIGNPLPWRPIDAMGSGLGLVGMRERVEISGGRLSVDESPHGFKLSAWLPWSA